MSIAARGLAGLGYDEEGLDPGERRYAVALRARSRPNGAGRAHGGAAPPADPDVSNEGRGRGLPGDARRIRQVLSALALQTLPRFGDVAGNLAAASALLGDASPDLVVAPELFTTGYAFRDRAEAASIAETFPGGPTCRWLRELSRRTGGVAVGGYVERDGDRLYNAAAVCAAGRALVSYRKIHLFGFEPEIFDPGPGPFPVVEHAGVRYGLMICFDWRFPEAARTLALAGADVLVHPSNLVMPHCQAAMVTRCLENRVFSVTANRVGTEHRPPRPALSFPGGSVVVTPTGETIARAPTDAPTALAASFDPALARNKRLTYGNDVFRDRRPDTYRL